MPPPPDGVRCILEVPVEDGDVVGSEIIADGAEDVLFVYGGVDVSPVGGVEASFGIDPVQSVVAGLVEEDGLAAFSAWDSLLNATGSRSKPLTS